MRSNVKCIYIRVNFILLLLNIRVVLMDKEENDIKDVKELSEEVDNIDKDLPEYKTPIEYESEICHLNAEILNLENSLNETKRHNKQLLEENSQLKTSNKRFSFAFKGRSMSINPSINQSKAYQLAEIIKEKNELQELNEKMLNMLTEKEIENGELREEYENYQQEKKFQIDELNEKISELQEELETYQSKDNQSDEDAIDELQNQYNIYKDEMEREIANYENRIEELKNQNDSLSDTILKLKSEIQALELENLQWLNNADQKAMSKQEEMGNLESTLNEVEKVKNQLRQSEETRASAEEKYKDIIAQKDSEIAELTAKKEELTKAMANMKQELTKENTKMIFEFGKVSKDLNNAKIKMNQYQSTIEQNAKKISEYKELLDKKTTELKEINDSAKKVIINKESVISQYEEKITNITKDKNELIDQNKSLLNQLKEKMYGTLNDLLAEEKEKEEAEKDTHETKLLKEEIKSLQDTIQTQANELVKMASIEEEAATLKEENEKMKKEINDVKKKYQEQIRTNDYKNIQLRSSLNFQKKRTMNFQRQMSITPKEGSSKLEKQIEFLTAMKENDKKRFQEQIDKLNLEIANQKVKIATQAFETDSLIVKYRKIIHRVVDECKKKGITINIKI